LTIYNLQKQISELEISKGTVENDLESEKESNKQLYNELELLKLKIEDQNILKNSLNNCIMKFENYNIDLDKILKSFELIEEKYKNENNALKELNFKLIGQIHELEKQESESCIQMNRLTY